MILNSFESIRYLGKWQNVHHHSVRTKTNFSFHHLLWCECINPQKCTGELKQRGFFLFIYSSTTTKIEPTNCISFCIYTKIDLIWTIIFFGTASHKEHKCLFHSSSKFEWHFHCHCSLDSIAQFGLVDKVNWRELPF